MISVECTATELVAEVTQETVFFEIINVLAHIFWSLKKQPSGNLETDFSRQYVYCRCQLSSSIQRPTMFGGRFVMNNINNQKKKTPTH